MRVELQQEFVPILNSYGYLALYFGYFQSIIEYFRILCEFLHFERIPTNARNL